MSARRVLNAFEVMLRESNTAEEVDAMLHPPTREDTLAERAALLHEMGALG
jgi:hypothetical protein